MPLTSRERQELIAASHRLKPAVTLSADEGAVPVAAVEQVRRAFASHKLIKVRVKADEGTAADAVAAQLAAEAACEVVKRIGRVVILYRQPAAGAEG